MSSVNLFGYRTCFGQKFGNQKTTPVGRGRSNNIEQLYVCHQSVIGTGNSPRRCRDIFFMVNAHSKLQLNYVQIYFYFNSFFNKKGGISSNRGEMFCRAMCSPSRWASTWWLLAAEASTLNSHLILPTLYGFLRT